MVPADPGQPVAVGRQSRRAIEIAATMQLHLPAFEGNQDQKVLRLARRCVIFADADQTFTFVVDGEIRMAGFGTFADPEAIEICLCSKTLCWPLPLQ